MSYLKILKITYAWYWRPNRPDELTDVAFLCSLQSVSTDVDSLFAFMLSVLYIRIQQQQHFIPFLKEQYSTKLRKEIMTETYRVLPLIEHHLASWYSLWTPENKNNSFSLRKRDLSSSHCKLTAWLGFQRAVNDPIEALSQVNISITWFSTSNLE